MRQVAEHIERRRRRVAQHPFFGWINDASQPLQDRFLFAPIVAEFVMGFADMNKWFLHYERAHDSLRENINHHTLEDRTHSRLFIEDWIKLGLDRKFAWSPSEILFWWFDSEETAFVRKSAMETLWLTVNHQDPLVRFAMMQAMEACGDVMFGNTVNVATELSSQTGIEYRYWGEYHRQRETGHLHTDESSFLGTVLTDEQRLRAMHLADRMFDMFAEDLDHALDYGRRAIEAPRALAEGLAADHARHLARARPVAGTREPSLQPRSAPNRVRDAVEAGKGELATHPFVQWLRHDDLSPVQKLQRFVPLWAIDVLGYKDFMEHLLRYPEPETAAERAINRWTERLGSHGVLYLKDWLTLGLDDALGWSSHEVIRFYFLGEQSEVHRRNMAEVKTYALTHPAPQIRYWLMSAWEAGGDVLFEATRALTARIEAAGGPPLDYWGDRHTLVEPVLASDPEAEGFSFDAAELSPEQEKIALEIVRTIFTNLTALFSLSEQVARSNAFQTSRRTEQLVTSPRSENKRGAFTGMLRDSDVPGPVGPRDTNRMAP